MKHAIQTLISLCVLTAPLLGHAAITSDYVCQDAHGAELSWDIQLASLDPIREQLYRNHMRVVVEGVEVEFTPDRVVLGKNGRIHATSRDGQYISVGALRKTGEQEDTQYFEGTVELKLKGPHGQVIQRAKGTKVDCNMHGEA